MLLLTAAAAAGCSADLARFDFQDGAAGSTNAISLPSAPMRRNAGIPPDEGVGYAGPQAGYGDSGYGDAYRPQGGGYATREIPSSGSQAGGYGSSPPAYDYGRQPNDYGRQPNPYQSQRMASLPPVSQDYASPRQDYAPQQPRDYAAPQRSYQAPQRDYSTSQPDYGARSAQPAQPQTREPLRAEPRKSEPPIRSAAITPHATRPSAGTGSSIEIQQGDTLFSIAKQYKVSIAELMKLNNLESPTLRPGQTLVLPRGRHAIVQRTAAAPAQPIAESSQAEVHAETHAPVPTSSVKSSDAGRGTYTVAFGESLYGIAHKLGVKVAELQQENGISDVTKIRPGTVLKLPAGAKESRIASAEPRSVASDTAGQSTAAPLTVKPRIINGETHADAAPQRVASLGPVTNTATDASAANESGKAPAGGLPEAPKLSGTGKFRWPAKGRIIASFGARPGKSHNDGINISVPQGAEVMAAESGVVAYAGNELKGYGNLLLIRHDGGWVSAYAHNDELLVKRGDKVRRGQVIAKAGATGAVDQPQVHFELRQESKPIDPMPYMEKQ